MAKHFGYYDDWKTEVLQCPKCGWKGTFEEGSVEHHNELMDCSCPECDSLEAPMLAIMNYPTTGESRANWKRLSKEEKGEVESAERFRADFEKKKLCESTSLPDIQETSFVLHWDFHDADPGSETVIKHGESILFREPAVYEGYERFIEVAKILRDRYGSALVDLVPTKGSWTYLYGDKVFSVETIEDARKKIFHKNNNA